MMEVGVMPKENINCIVMDGLRAEVSWRPDAGEGTGYVQLATVHTDSPATIPAQPPETVGSKSAATLPAQGTTTAAAENTATEARERLDGWHVTLDRDQCNRAIRILRRARDAAFGTDA